jgi:uracil-DNA glycosylase family 4
MFIQDVAGRADDSTGYPAAGQSGQVLRRLVDQIHGHEGVAYGTVVRCRATEHDNVDRDRRPTLAEIRCCRPNLLRDLDRLKPRQIVLCGDLAAKALAQRSDGTNLEAAVSLGTLRSQEFFVETPAGLKIPASVTYHYGFVARNPKVGTLWRDDIVRAFLRATGKVPDYSQRGTVKVLDTIELVEQFARRVGRLTKDDVLVVDYETESAARFNNPLLCAGFAFGPDRGYVVPLQHPEACWRGDQYRQVKQTLQQILTAPAPYTVVAHNAKFELLATHDQLGFWIDAPVADTMLRAHALNSDRVRAGKRRNKKETAQAHNEFDQAVLDAEDAEAASSVKDTADAEPDGGYGLKALCKEWLGFYHYDDPDIKPVVEKRNAGKLATVPFPALAQYNAMDCYVTWRLYRFQDAVADQDQYRKKLHRLGTKLHAKVLNVLAEMETNGLLIDLKYLQGLLTDDSQVFARMHEIEHQFFALPSVKEANRRLLAKQYRSGAPGMWQQAGGDAWTYQMNKPDAKATLLFDVLDLDPVNKVLPGSKPSVNKELFERYEGVQEVDLLAEWTSLRTIKQNNLVGMDKALRESPDMRDGRARANFRPGGTVTGRISATKPNVLNVPKKPEDGQEKKASAALIKRMFICDPGHCMVAGDYSQAEVRWLAELTQDPDLIAAFAKVWEARAACLRDPSPENIKRLASEGDFHKHTAAVIHEVPVDQVTDEQRGQTKGVVFGQIYGQGLQALAAKLGVTKAKAEEFTEKFFARFPLAREQLGEMARQGFERGYAESPTGRRKKFASKLVVESLDALRYESQAIRGFKGREDRISRNMPIQGISSDMNLLACHRIVQHYRAHGLPWRLINSVYDSIMLEVPHRDARQCLEVVQAIMESQDLFAAFRFTPTVQFMAEMSIGTNWGNQVDITAGGEKWKVQCRACKASREEKQRVQNRRCEACGSTNIRVELVKGPEAVVLRWLGRQVKREAG